MTKDVANRLFYYLSYGYQFTSIDLIADVEKDLREVVRDIISNYKDRLERGESGRPAVKPYHTMFAARDSPEKKSDHAPSKEKQPNLTIEKVEIYLNKEVNHPKTELTEFCHQMKIQEPSYTKEAEGKIFNIKCTVKIPEERTEFRSRAYTS